MLTKRYILKSLFSGRERVPWDHERVPDYLFYETSAHGDVGEKKVDVSEALSKIEKQVNEQDYSI